MAHQKWNEIISSTEGFTIPVKGSQLINSEEIQEYHRLIKEVIVSFSNEQEPFNGLKCFRDGLQDNALNEYLIANPPKNQESLELWSQRLFEGNPFGMVMNFLEDYNNDLVQKMAQLVSPLLSQAGYPLAGLSMLFFMGDYGFTPFGAHKGTLGEDGFLFHLGPANKKFYTWETTTYNELTGGVQGYRELSKILPYGEEHLLKPGDVMFIPSEVYHVANTEEFSVSLVLDFRKATRETVKKILVDNMAFSLEDKVKLVNPVSDFEQPEKDIDFSENSREAFKKHLAVLRSNGGFAKPSQSKHIQLSWEFKYQLKRPFKIIQYPFEDKRILLARGHEIPMEDEQEMNQIIIDLNDGVVLDSNYFESKGFSLYDPILLSLLSQLIQSDIIDIKKPE